MAFRVNSDSLYALLSTVGKAVGKKSTLPILDYFLLKVENNTLTATAFDGSTSLSGTTSVEGDNAIIATPARLTLDVLKQFEDTELTLDISSTFVLTISHKKGAMQIPCTNPTAFPMVAQEEGVQFSILVDTLLAGINKTVFATADDELRPVMNGIFCNLTTDGSTFVGTDAHKLVKYVDPTPISENVSFILPSMPASILSKLLLKEDGSVTVSVSPKIAKFEMANYTLTCRLVEGNYPNYNAVIPSNNPHKLSVNRVEIINAIKRVSVCANTTTNLIRMNICDNTITITAQDLDFSVSAKESLMVAYSDAPVEIGFKATFLLEVLNNIDSEVVELQLADCTRAGVFIPEKQDNLVSILMPMMIS